MSEVSLYKSVEGQRVVMALYDRPVPGTLACALRDAHPAHAPRADICHCPRPRLGPAPGAAARRLLQRPGVGGAGRVQPFLPYLSRWTSPVSRASAPPPGRPGPARPMPNGWRTCGCPERADHRLMGISQGGWPALKAATVSRTGDPPRAARARWIVRPASPSCCAPSPSRCWAGAASKPSTVSPSAASPSLQRRCAS